MKCTIQDTLLCPNGVLIIHILQFMSNCEIRRVQAPSLFLSGLADQLIPSKMMMELYQVHMCHVIL